MQMVRGCDVKRNVLVYMLGSDRIIEGSPNNSRLCAMKPRMGMDGIAWSVMPTEVW